MTSLIQGTLFGLGAAVPIGQVNVEIARRTLRGGFPAGFFLGLGACSIDVLYAVVTAVGIGPWLNRPAVQTPLAVSSVALLGYLGATCIRAAFKHDNGDSTIDQNPPSSILNPPSSLKSYLTGLAMTATNPMTITFWVVGVAGTTASQGLSLPWVCCGVFAATISWVAFFTTSLTMLRRFDQNRWLPIADLAGGATLIFFAARTVWRLTRSHL